MYVVHAAGAVPYTDEACGAYVAVNNIYDNNKKNNNDNEEIMGPAGSMISLLLSILLYVCTNPPPTHTHTHTHTKNMSLVPPVRVFLLLFCFALKSITASGEHEIGRAHV